MWIFELAAARVTTLSENPLMSLRLAAHMSSRYVSQGHHASSSQSPDRPPSPPKILHPSPSYLATSLIPSTPLQNPCTQRKLLILDLNGTLLIRPKRRLPIESYLRKGQRSSAPGPRFLPVHPRPYMPTFKQYLFLGHRPIDSDGRHQQGEGTKAWLDVMVWSSAQPHNVGNMVEKCFGVVADNNIDVVEKEKERSGDLVAVWARDTLDLTDVQYHKKSQTTKDLEKPWLALPNTQHNAQTTLLLDDSPLKAQLQPWNHICIKEYDSTLRNGDLEILREEKERDANVEFGYGSSLRGKKRERKEKNKNKSYKKPHPEPLGLERHSSSTSSSTYNSATSVESIGEYDETLLAIIGILDTIKMEDNIAGWIRAGGLWGPHNNGGVISHLSSSSESTGQEEKDVMRMWFEHRPTFNYWVSRGRETVERLGIPLVHGIVN